MGLILNNVDVFLKFLKLLKVKLTKGTVKAFLENHPDSGSLKAFSDILTNFNIENAAAKITIDDLKDIPTPLFTFLKVDGGIFTIVKSFQNGILTWLHREKGWVKTEAEEFSENWSGIVLFAEPGKSSGEQDFELKRRMEKIKIMKIPIAIGLLCIILSTLVFTSEITLPSVKILLFIKFLGMIATGLLLVKSIDSTNGLVNKICTSGSKVNCQSILDGPAAKITSWFSWSDAGFIYFYGSFFCLLLAVNSATSLSSLLGLQALFSGLSIVFSTYSLYYQAIKVKIWCPLCLGVVGLFFLEATIISFYHAKNVFIFEVIPLLKPFVGFLIPIVFLLIFKNTALRANQGSGLLKELIRLKSNPKIFEALMASQRQMKEIPTHLPRIILGNQEAWHTITLVSNPLCGPCAKIHLEIEVLLQKDQNMKCEIIFLSNSDRNDPGGKFVRKVFSLPPNLRAKAIELWYTRNDKNFEAWNTEYMKYEEKSGISEIQTSHNDWANEAEIKGTPTLFLNGISLPKIIKVEDLSLYLSHFTRATEESGFANQSI